MIWRQVRNGCYPCTKASSTTSARAQQPPSHAAQSLPRSRPYTSPQTSTKPGQTVSPCGFLAGEWPALTHQKAWETSLLKTAEQLTLWVTSSSGEKSTLLAGNSQRKKEKKESCRIKSSTQMVFSAPAITSPHLEFVAVTKMSPIKPWVQCMWEEQDRFFEEGMGENSITLQQPLTSRQCRQGLLWGHCFSRQSDKKKVLSSTQNSSYTNQGKHA